MNQFVQGTIIPVVWRFERPNGNKFFISIYDITLQLIHPRGVENIMPVVGDGFITFTLMPQLQKSLGKYSLRLSASLNGEQVLRCEQKDFLMITSKRYASTAVEMMADAPTVELLTVAEFGLFGDGITADEVQALLKDKVSKSYVDDAVGAEAERAKAMENALMQEHSELYGSIMQETQRAEAAETALQEKTKHISSNGEDTTEVTGDFVVNGTNIVDSIGDLEDKTDSIIEDVNQLQGYTGYVANIAKDAEATANKAKAIAEGKATGYVFNTVADMNAWIMQHKAELHLGDNLYIRDTNVPDYWWDGEHAQELETQKVDLDDYYTKEETGSLFATIQNVNMMGENLQSAIDSVESTCSERTEALATDIAALDDNKQDNLTDAQLADIDSVPDKADKINVADYFHEGAVLPYPAAYNWYSQIPNIVSFRKEEYFYIAFCATHDGAEAKGLYYAFFRTHESDPNKIYTFFKLVDFTTPEDEWYQLGLHVFNEDLREKVTELESGKQNTLIPGSGITIEGNVISATGGGGESGKRGVISQTQTWASDYSGYTMSNLVWGTIPQANLDLFLTAGALFNNTANVIERTALWGETVQHLPGYFYLNGLGDISYNEMMFIYELTNTAAVYEDAKKIAAVAYKVRTNLPFMNMRYGRDTGPEQTNVDLTSFSRPPANVLMLPGSNYYGDWRVSGLMSVSSLKRFIWNGPRTCQVVFPYINISSCKTLDSLYLAFDNARGLRIIYLYGLCYSIDFKVSAFLRRECVRYMIDNAINTSVITITLHADAYARLTDDDKVAATTKNINLVIA